MFLLTYMSLNNINFRQLSLGERIINRLEELKMSMAEFARLMDMDQSNLKKYLQKPDMDTGRLVQISQSLRYNFFMEFCDEGKFSDLKDDHFYINDKVKIGNHIKRTCKGLNMTQEEFAIKLTEALNDGNTYRQSDVSKIFSRGTVNTTRLMVVSQILNHNFFEDYCQDPVDTAIFSGDRDAQRESRSNEFLELVKRNEELVSKLAVQDYIINALKKRLENAGLSSDVDTVI